MNSTGDVMYAKATRKKKCQRKLIDGAWQPETRKVTVLKRQGDTILGTVTTLGTDDRPGPVCGGTIRKFPSVGQGASIASGNWYYECDGPCSA